MSFTYNGIWRMDWGLGNPNLTAALILTLMIGVWVLPYFFRKPGFYFALVISCGLAVCLAHTMSRGGLVGIVIGLAVLVVSARVKFRPREVLLVASGFLLVGLIVCLLNLQGRFGHGLLNEDKSVSHRIDIWKVAPTMMVDSVCGWGWGKSGEAYMAWYQPLDREERYGSLVSSHISKIVELGWIGGIVYVFFWCFVILICLPNAVCRWRCVPLGLIAGFGAAAFFSNFFTSWIIWIVPALALLSAVLSRFWLDDWPRSRDYLNCLIISLVLMLATFIIGVSSAPSLVASRKDAVIYGGDSPRMWILVDQEILGNGYARVFREHVDRFGRQGGVLDVAGFVFNQESLPEEVNVLVAPRKYESFGVEWLNKNPHGRLILVNPVRIPDTKSQRYAVIVGEYCNPFGGNMTGENLFIVDGTSEFLPDWPRAVNRVINSVWPDINSAIGSVNEHASQP